MGESEKKRNDDNAKGATRRRSVAIALMLGLLVSLFYAATIVRLGGNAMNKGQMAVPQEKTKE